MNQADRIAPNEITNARRFITTSNVFMDMSMAFRFDTQLRISVVHLTLPNDFRGSLA